MLSLLPLDIKEEMLWTRERPSTYQRKLYAPSVQSGRETVGFAAKRVKWGDRRGGKDGAWGFVRSQPWSVSCVRLAVAKSCPVSLH